MSSKIVEWWIKNIWKDHYKSTAVIKALLKSQNLKTLRSGLVYFLASQNQTKGVPINNKLGKATGKKQVILLLNSFKFSFLVK